MSNSSTSVVSGFGVESGFGASSGDDMVFFLTCRDLKFGPI